MALFPQSLFKGSEINFSIAGTASLGFTGLCFLLSYWAIVPCLWGLYILTWCYGWIGLGYDISADSFYQALIAVSFIPIMAYAASDIPCLARRRPFFLIMPQVSPCWLKDMGRVVSPLSNGLIISCFILDSILSWNSGTISCPYPGWTVSIIATFALLVNHFFTVRHGGLRVIVYLILLEYCLNWLFGLGEKLVCSSPSCLGGGSCVSYRSEYLFVHAYRLLGSFPALPIFLFLSFALIYLVQKKQNKISTWLNGSFLWGLFFFLTLSITWGAFLSDITPAETPNERLNPENHCY